MAAAPPQGAFVGVRRPGSGKPISVGGVPLLVEALSGATGLELKADPGVFWVYLGYAIIMPTTFVSLFTYSQARVHAASSHAPAEAAEAPPTFAARPPHLRRFGPAALGI